MKLNYYVAIVDNRELDILKLHLKSLEYYCPNVFDVVVASSFPTGIEGVKEVIVPIYEQLSTSLLNKAGYDFCNRIHPSIAMGSSDWFVVAHADIIYRSSLLVHISPYFKEDIGMIGCWPHRATTINRKIYNQCHLGFWPLPNIYMQKDLNLVGLFERMEEGVLSISSLDIGDALRIEIQGYGYKYERMGDSVGNIYHHIGALSGHAKKVLPSEEKAENHINELEKKKALAISMFNNFK